MLTWMELENVWFEQIQVDQTSLKQACSAVWFPPPEMFSLFMVSQTNVMARQLRWKNGIWHILDSGAQKGCFIYWTLTIHLGTWLLNRHWRSVSRVKEDQSLLFFCTGLLSVYMLSHFSWIYIVGLFVTFICLLLALVTCDGAKQILVLHCNMALPE